MIKEFNGKIKNGRVSVPLTGVQMFEKLKDKKVEFGKRKIKKKKKKRRKKSGRRDLFFGISITDVIWTSNIAWMGCTSLRTYLRFCTVHY
jgi:hypothetical protein